MLSGHLDQSVVTPYDLSPAWEALSHRGQAVISEKSAISWAGDHMDLPGPE